MKLLLRAVIVVALLAQIASAVVATRYNRAYRQGVQASGDFMLANAWEAFDRARHLRPADSTIWTWAGDTAMSMAEAAFAVDVRKDTNDALERAWRDYSGAVLRCPRDSWSWSGLAAVSMMRARLRDRAAPLDLDLVSRRAHGEMDADRAIALAAAELAVELNPSGYVELDVLADMHAANGDLDTASELFVESARRMPAPSFHSWGGGRTLSKSLYRAVLEGLEAGLQSAPANEHSLLRYQIGRLAFRQGDRETALRNLEQALELARSPYEVFQASSEIAAVLQDEGKLVEARDALLRAEETGYVPHLISRRLGQVSLLLKDLDVACVELREALRSSPKDTGLRLQTANACESAGEVDLAERLLRDGFVLPTDDMTLARALLDHYRRVGRDSTAAGLARSWIRENPERTEFREWASEFDVAEF